MSEAERKMFGFEVIAEYTGRLFPSHPGDLRANTDARYPFIPELRRGNDRRAAPVEGMGTA